MFRRDYRYFDQLNYDDLMIDNDEKLKLEQIKIENTRLLNESNNLYKQFAYAKFMYTNTFPQTEENKIKLDNTFNLFEEIFNKMNMDYKVEFCIKNLKFRYTISEALKECPVNNDYEIVYHLMRTAGWPEDVVHYKFKNLKVSEKNRIDNILKLENVLRYKNPLDNNFEFLTEQYSSSFSSFVEDSFGSSLKRSVEEMNEEDSSNVRIDLQQELSDYSVKKKKMLEEIQQSVPLFDNTVMEVEQEMK